jgi:hypothetical protein
MSIQDEHDLTTPHKPDHGTSQPLQGTSVIATLLIASIPGIIVILIAVMLHFLT